MATDLSGKAALITGGSRGIGAAIVRRFAQDGASVTFTYNSSEEKTHALADGIKTNGGTRVAIKANNSDPE
jgi:3-oxoacyl-[acyl-carrier protein] reductase